MKILSLTVNEFTGGLEHLIEFVHWEHEGIKSSTKLLPPKKIFKPLAEVTEDQIIAWVWNQDRAKIEKFLSNKKIAKTVEFGSVPELSEEAEAAKRDYWVDWATKRLAQYVLLEGRQEVNAPAPEREANRAGRCISRARGASGARARPRPPRASRTWRRRSSARTW